MLLTGKEDMRVRKTITAIKNAFEALICEKDYEQITVKELCDRAVVNKKTFYHYYPTLDDLLGEMQSELSAGYIERIKDYVLPDELDKVNREFYLFSEEQGLAYEKITCGGPYSHIRQEMINRVTAASWRRSKRFNSLDPQRQNILIDFINTSTAGIYRQWVLGGKAIPLEEIIAITNRLLCGGVDGFFQTEGKTK